MIRGESPDLVRYLGEFGLTLSDLTPQQVSMFVAARNAAHHVEGLEVPIGSELGHDHDPSLKEVEDDRALDMIAHDDASLESHLPADEMDVRLIRSTEDLPRIFPIQWLLEEIEPELFYARLAQGELLMPQWQRSVPGRRDRSEESPFRELVEEPAAAETPRLHAYVLLDTSTSMQDHDRRGTVARGLALEFLRKGYVQGAHLLLRPFTVEVGELSSGSSPDDFRTITRRLISLPNAGQTRIQTALEQAVEGIRGAGPCLGASIMLISDGISRLTRNPLGDEKLHTFILGDLFDKEAMWSIEVLKQWSDTFHRVWHTRFANLLAPTLRDCQAAGLLLQAMLDAAEDPSGSEAGRLRRVLESARFLVDEFKRSLGRAAHIPREVRALDEQLHEAETRIGRAVEQTLPARDEQPFGSGGRTLRSAWIGGNREGVPQRITDLWEYVRRIVSRAWQWTRRLCRALLHRDEVDA